MASSVFPLPSPFKSPFKVLNPTTLFIAFSLGLHGLILFLIFPNVNAPLGSKLGEEGEGNVSVIELSEAEKAQIPDLSAQSSDLGDFNFPSSANVPENTASGLEIDPLALQSALPNLPPPPPSLPPLDYNYRSNLPITITPPSIRSIPPSRVYRSWQNTPNYPSFRPNLPSPPPNLPGMNPTPSYNPYNTPYNSSVPNSRPSFAPLRDPIDPDELINRRYNQPQLEDNGQNPEQIAANSPNNQENGLPALRQPSARQLQEERIRRLVAESQARAGQLRYNGENTTEDDEKRNAVAWMNQNRIATKIQSVSLRGNYPKSACLSQLSGTAIYAFTVSPQGMVQNPSLVRSSGYPILNEQGLRQITSSNFANTTGQVQPYRASVNFSYNSSVCGTGTPITPQPTENTVKPSPIPLPITPVTPSIPKPNNPEPIQENTPSSIQTVPRQNRRNPSSVPSITPKPVNPAPTVEETPVIIENTPEPSPVTPQPETVEQPVKPAPNATQQPVIIENTPKPAPENQPPAPSAVRKAPVAPENQPPAPSAVRKAPVVPQNQPPAPAAVEKPSPSIQESQNQPPAAPASRKQPSEPQASSAAPSTVE